MAAPLREQFKNLAWSQLNGSIDSSQTTITVVDGSIFPATGNFRVRLDTGPGPTEQELMLCTARSGNTLTVVRGIEGYAAASHPNEEYVIHVVTDVGLNNLVKDSVVLAGDDSPAPPLNKIVGDDGKTILTASDFTWVNQGTATATDQGGTLLLTVPPASGENARTLVRTAPSAPYSYIGAFRHVGFRSDDNSSVPNFGMLLRQSSSGKFTSITLLVDGNGSSRLQVGNWSNATSSPSTVVTRAHFGLIGPELWFKVEDDNTNIKFYVGDGLAWFQIYSVSRTNHMTTTGPDQVGLYGNHFGSNGKWESLVRLCHFSRAS